MYYDLGLATNIGTTREFVSSNSENAYEPRGRIVTLAAIWRALGQTLAGRWRYAESVTLRGLIYKEAWRYRDYVIESFNDDVPFDFFIRQQISGDLLEAEGFEQRRKNLIATGYLAMGNNNLEDQDKEKLRMDAVDEQLETIGRGLLAQTIGCARCHDHKFDPIPTSDYYALAGILRSTE